MWTNDFELTVPNLYLDPLHSVGKEHKTNYCYVRVWHSISRYLLNSCFGLIKAITISYNFPIHFIILCHKSIYVKQFISSTMSPAYSDLSRRIANLAADNIVEQVLRSLSQIWGELPNDRNISTPLFFLLYIRYLMFIKLKKLYPHQILIPMYDIDLIWHSHQLCTEAYQRDTINYLGKKNAEEKKYHTIINHSLFVRIKE